MNISKILAMTSLLAGCTAYKDADIDSLSDMSVREIGIKQTLQFPMMINGEQVELVLHENKELFAADYQELEVMSDNTTYARNNVAPKTKYLQGKVITKTPTALPSFAALRARQGENGIELDGLVQVDGENFDVEVKDGTQTVEHVETDPVSSCGTEDHPRPFEDSNHYLSRGPKVVDGTRYVEVRLVNDTARWDKYGEDVWAHSANLVNIEDALWRYGDFDAEIRVVLKEHVTFTRGDYFRGEEDETGRVYAETLLDSVTQWTDSYPPYVDSRWPDTTQLISGQRFSGGTLGIAYVGRMCDNRSVSAQEDTHSSLELATTMAHEMGHTWGLPHDREPCAQSGNIMAAYAGHQPFTDWSDCSVWDINYILAAWDYTCVED